MGLSVPTPQEKKASQLTSQRGFSENDDDDDDDDDDDSPETDSDEDDDEVHGAPLEGWGEPPTGGTPSQHWTGTIAVKREIPAALLLSSM